MNKSITWPIEEFEKIDIYRYKLWCTRLEKHVPILTDKIYNLNESSLKRRLIKKLIFLIQITYDVKIKSYPNNTDRMLNLIFINELFVLVNEELKEKKGAKHG